MTKPKYNCPILSEAASLRSKDITYRVLYAQCLFEQALNEPDKLRGSGDTLAPAIRALDIGEEEVMGAAALLKRVQDESRPLWEREIALSLVFYTPVGAETFEAMQQRDRIMLSGPWIRPMIKVAGGTDVGGIGDKTFGRLALMMLYRSTPVEARTLLVDKMVQEFRAISGDVTAFVLLLRVMDNDKDPSLVAQLTLDERNALSADGDEEARAVARLYAMAH